MKEPAQISEIDLVARIKDGDPVAESELIKRFKVIERIEVMIRARIYTNREDQDDLINDVLLSVVTNLRRGMYNPEKGALGSYLWGIVRNKLRDFMKPNAARERNMAALEPNLVDFNESALVKNERKNMLRTLVKQLDWKYQEILILRYYEDLSIDDIASQLELTSMQVYNRIHYALALMREGFKKM